MIFKESFGHDRMSFAGVLGSNSDFEPLSLARAGVKWLFIPCIENISTKLLNYKVLPIRSFTVENVHNEKT